MPSDIEIAQAAKLQRIPQVAKEKLGISEDHLEPYGHYKAKVSLPFVDSLKGKPNGKLVLVTAISPTPAGEGKTTTTVGLGDALNYIGKKAIICLREPSLGPVFGVKGGAAGGGYAQIVPMEDINLHFTGDFSAIALANNLLAALIDNHINHGNELGITTGRAPQRSLRYWILGAVLVASAASGLAAWESVNPVTMTQRALIFGGGLAWGVTAAVFVFDLFVAPRGWCGHLCPAGAAYALIGAKSLLRVSATHSSRCNDCADCYAVCPEPQVIPAPLKARDGAGPVIRDAACTNCGRCIDVCSKDVFRLTHRFDLRRD